MAIDDPAKILAFDFSIKIGNDNNSVEEIRELFRRPSYDAFGFRTSNKGIFIDLTLNDPFYVYFQSVIATMEVRLLSRGYPWEFQKINLTDFRVSRGSVQIDFVLLIVSTFGGVVAIREAIDMCRQIFQAEITDMTKLQTFIDVKERSYVLRFGKKDRRKFKIKKLYIKMIYIALLGFFAIWFVIWSNRKQEEQTKELIKQAIEEYKVSQQ